MPGFRGAHGSPNRPQKKEEEGYIAGRVRPRRRWPLFPFSPFSLLPPHFFFRGLVTATAQSPHTVTAQSPHAVTAQPQHAVTAHSPDTQSQHSHRTQSPHTVTARSQYAVTVMTQLQHAAHSHSTVTRPMTRRCIATSSTLSQLHNRATMRQRCNPMHAWYYLVPISATPRRSAPRFGFGMQRGGGELPA